MKVRITQTQSFAQEIDSFLESGRLSQSEFESLKRSVAERSEEGEFIHGVEGVQKLDFRCLLENKDGSFAVYYFHDLDREEVFLLFIEHQDKKENLVINELPKLF